MQGFCRVAVDSRVFALDRPFDYAIPERLIGRVAVGSVVRVILHGRNMRGFVTDLLDAPEVERASPLRSLVSEEPLFDASGIELARWTARRYVAPLGLVLHDAVPGRFSAPADSKGAASVSGPPASRGGELATTVRDGAHAVVLPAHLDDEPAVVAEVAAAAAALGRRVLVICPRVATAETVASSVAGAVVLHGQDRPAERAAAWAAARDGRAGVVVGGRSALLVPVPDLGAVIVVSCHDRSLKSERTPRVHALHAARQRARAAGAAFIATGPAPPLELAGDRSLRWVSGGRGHVRAEIARPRRGPVTTRLIEVVRSAVDRGSNALVFVARRGDALRLRCLDCGWTPSCPACGAGLSRSQHGLTCRVCGAQAGVPERCGGCGGELAERGWGHERVARELERTVGAPVERLVRGTVPEPRDHPAVLVGTIAAAHTSGRFGAVCVADLDQLLARPDFRAGERALQTMHELAGVLEPGGRFLIQTREPDHHAVQAFTRQSYRYFADRELEHRRQTGYPPFGVVVRVDTPAAAMADLEAVARAAGGGVVGGVASGAPSGGMVATLVRAPALDVLLDGLRRFATEHPKARIDVDPVDVL